MTSSAKIIFFTNTMTAGGAERVMTNMVNYLAIEGKGEREVILLTSAVTEDFYSLNKSVKRSYLDDLEGSTLLFLKPFKFIKRWFVLRRIVLRERPQAIVSFLENVNLLNILGCFGTSTQSIISIRNDPRKNEIGYLLRFMRKALYPFANKLVVQTNSVRDWCLENRMNKNIIVIPNSVKVSNEVWRDQYDGSRPYRFVAAGRLVSQKGFDLLLDACALLREMSCVFCLDIYGKGPLKEPLKDQVKKLSLEEYISFKGLTHNLEERLLESDAFVLSSRYEGFPNVLIEALALGMPVVSFNCKSGPSDIIHNYVDGLLVEDGNIEALAKGMEELIKERSLREKVSRAARENIRRFEISSIMTHWEDLF
jgi:GalNAc-alpha-(1->4)-GalNAc-alpha-(1->3)-diNAcBac-PP-undecaprenol alpha-1,4-N-acetyl-D-galactosaminyltransferase